MKFDYDFRHSNGILWHRLWWQGIGFWTQALQNRDGWTPWWPSGPHIRIWSTSKRRIAILLPDRRPPIKLRRKS